MKKIKIAHWIFTVLFSALMLMSASMYIMNYDVMVQLFPILGFPAWIIIPLATLKILGVIMLFTKLKTWLTEWAYAGFFFNALLAFGAHMSVGDGEQGGAIMALILLLGSYICWKYTTNQPKHNA
jgi:hypothetical protein